MSIYQKLLNIQSVLKCNKSQYNSFGKYHYRSCEDILEAAKPICHKNGCVLTVSDEIIFVGDRYYICATATLTDIETGEQVTNNAFAREEENKKGMDGSQITGTASSYARKYCLNGLFCLDDTKDADTDEFHEATNKTFGKPAAKPVEKKTAKSKVDTLKQLIARKGGNIGAMLQYFKVSSVEELSETDLDRAIGQLEKKADI